MRQLLPTMLIALVMTACGQKSNQASTPDGDEVTLSSPKEMNDMSIYQFSSSWITQNGDEITFEDLKGEILIVTMIYTSCQSACPRLVEAVKAIESKVSTSILSGVRYVFITIDPEYDTPARLKEYAVKNGMEDSRWLFLQGTEESVMEFANVVAVRYNRISPIEFSHSNIVTVFDPHGVMVYQQEGLVTDYEGTVEAVINAYEANVAVR
jgi:protein SCO1/2